MRQDEFLSEECISETQNSTQSRSQPLDVITCLANMMKGDRNDISPTPTFKHPRIGEVGSTSEGRSTSILKHIGCTYEEDQEVFGNALNDRPTPISPTPLVIGESNVHITLAPSSQRPREPTKTGEDCRKLKTASVQGLKSSARRKAQ